MARKKMGSPSKKLTMSPRDTMSRPMGSNMGLKKRSMLTSTAKSGRKKRLAVIEENFGHVPIR